MRLCALTPARHGRPRRLHACLAIRTSCQIWLQSWRHLVAISRHCHIAIMAVPNHRLRANAPACIDAGAPCAPRRSHACVAMRTSCLIWLQSWRHLVAIMAVPSYRLRANAPARIDAGTPGTPRRSGLCRHAHILPDSIAIMVRRLVAISWHRLIAIMAVAQPSDCNDGASSDCNHGAPPGCNHWQRLHTDKIARWMCDSHWICGAHDCLWRLAFQCAGAQCKIRAAHMA